MVDVRLELPPFYAKLGFREIGTAPFRDQRLLLRPAHLILMTKPLDQLC